MAQSPFTLSTRRPQAGESVAGRRLSAPTIPVTAGMSSGSNAVSLHPAIANIKTIAAPLPTVSKNYLLEGALSFMETAADAAMRYQERESDYLAKQAAMSFQAEVYDAYNGYSTEEGHVKGFASLKGQEILDGYQPFNEFIDSKFEATLQSLEPRVRQKAMLNMATIRNSLRSKVAGDRLKAFEALEADQKFNELQVMVEEVEMSPELLFTEDLAGNTLLERMRAKFTSDEEFTKWWGTTIKEVTGNRYWETYSRTLESSGDPNEAAVEAYKTARDYAVMVAQPTLASNPAAENDVLAMLDRFQNEALAAQANRVKIASDMETAANERLEQEQLVQLRALRAKVLSGQATVPSQEAFVRMSSYLKQADYNTFYSAFYEPFSERGNPVEEVSLLRKAQQGRLTDEMTAIALGNPQIRTAIVDRAMAIQSAVVDEKIGQSVKSGLNFVDTLFVESGLEADLISKFRTSPQKQELEQLYNAAQDSMRACIEGGGELGYCKMKTELSYDQVKDSATSLPNLVVEGNAERPANVKQLEHLGNKLFVEKTAIEKELAEAHAAGEPPSVELKRRQAVYEETFEIYNRWYDWFQKRQKFEEQFPNR